MENPFDLIDQRLQAIEEKLDGLLEKTRYKSGEENLVDHINRYR